jgi:GAF domain-containing protein
MRVPPVPRNENERLAALHETGLLDTQTSEDFDRITRIARRLFNVQSALVSLVAEDRQWFKSRVGLDARETPREVSFCGHTILGQDVMVVEDASIDPRFDDNQLVVDGPTIRFYAGCPVHTPDGHTIGTFCIIDDKPRTFDAEDRAMLRDLASLTETQIGLRFRSPGRDHKDTSHSIREEPGV